ncbi:MAG: DUF502 domain-containing protein [Candidatus Calescibacterium sp.]|nr:DUF502 domain-containing protein [Candidatus Calescibacterium sp.]
MEVKQTKEKNKRIKNILENTKKFVKENFIVGLIFFGPVFGTIYVLIIIFGFLDGILSGIYDKILGIHIPGLGFITLFLMVLATGVLARTYLASFLIQAFENTVSKIPIAKSIYSALKNITEMVQKSNGRFGRPTAIKLNNGYLPGLELTSDKDYSVFLLPSTPNPTTGFVFILPKKDVANLKASLDDFMKFMVSMGIYSAPIVESVRVIEKEVKSQQENEKSQNHGEDQKQ